MTYHRLSNLMLIIYKRNIALSKKLKGKLTTYNQSEIFECNRCGTLHGKRNCPAYGEECRTCGRPNHFGAVCRSNKMGQKMSNQDVHTIEDKEDTFTNQLFGVNIGQIHNL